jgi:hypothetical protein
VPVQAPLIPITAGQNLQYMQERVSRFNWFMMHVICTCLLPLFLVIAGAPTCALIVLMLAIVASIPIYRWDNERRTIRLEYDTSKPQIIERVAAIGRIGKALTHAQKMWHVYHTQNTFGWQNNHSLSKKHNAGATSILKRTEVYCSQQTLPNMEVNVETWSIPIGPQRLFFLPDYLLLIDGGRFIAIPYEGLRAQAEISQFIEDGMIPNDARCCAYTWQYVNRRGGPDLRFSYNRQLPVLEYGDILLSSHNISLCLQTSNPLVAQAVAESINMLAKLSLEEDKLLSEAKQEVEDYLA